MDLPDAQGLPALVLPLAGTGSPDQGLHPGHNLLDAHVVRVYEREKGQAGMLQTAILLAQEEVRVAIDAVGSRLPFSEDHLTVRKLL